MVVLLDVVVVEDLCDEVAGALLAAEDDDLRFISPLCEAADPEVRELVADVLLLWLSDEAAGRAVVLRDPWVLV